MAEGWANPRVTGFGFKITTTSKLGESYCLHEETHQTSQTSNIKGHSAHAS